MGASAPSPMCTFRGSRAPEGPYAVEEASLARHTGHLLSPSNQPQTGWRLVQRYCTSHKLGRALRLEAPGQQGPALTGSLASSWQDSGGDMSKTGEVAEGKWQRLGDRGPARQVFTCAPRMRCQGQQGLEGGSSKQGGALLVEAFCKVSTISTLPAFRPTWGCFFPSLCLRSRADGDLGNKPSYSLCGLSLQALR